MTTVNLNQSASVALIKGSIKGKQEIPCLIGDLLDNMKGRYVVQHYRNGERINEYHFDNGITDEGKDKLLNVMFDSGTQITSWFAGIINNSGFTALADDDTYDDIDQAGNGWDEFQAYTDTNNGASTTTRPLVNFDPASAQSITNGTVANYAVTGTATIKGIFLVGGIAGAQTKGDHAPGGTLWNTALFSGGDVAVESGDTLKVTYTVSA